MSLILRWGDGQPTQKVEKKKETNKQKKRTAIHHNTSHPWFIVQAQVSVIQHCGEPPGSCEAPGQTAPEGTVISTAQWQPARFTQTQCRKVELAQCSHVIQNSYDAQRSQEPLPHAVWPRTRFLFRHHLKKLEQSIFDKLTLVHTSDFTKFYSNVSGLHEEEMRMPRRIGADQVRRLVFLFLFFLGRPPNTGIAKSHRNLTIM